MALSFSSLSLNLLNFLLQKGVLFSYYAFLREAEILYDLCSWAKRMLAMMEDFIFSEPSGHFARSVRDGESVLLLQLGSNAHGSFLMISELLHGRRKGFIIVPEGKSGSGWRGFCLHLRKAIAPEALAINLPPKPLPGSNIKNSKSFAAAVVQGRRGEPKTHRQAAAESSQNDGSGGHKGKHLMLDS